VTEIVAFTDNIRDLSNTMGYQFEFICERCGNGYRSPFVRDKKEMGKGLLRSAGSLLGGRVADLSHASEQFQWDRATNSPAKNKAMEEAVAAVREEFRQCRGCGNWVCAPVCWNDEIGQCLNCSPSVAEEVSRAQAAAQVKQVWEKAETVDWTSDLDIAERAKVTCGDCHAKVDGGKFCPECGAKLSRTVFCTNCGTEEKEGAKFCGECGTKF
jgi:membrane protease subunit (stomatin/prohibitin family)